MQHLAAGALAGLALTASLVGMAPTATASDFDCDDPAHPIDAGRGLDVVVGTTKTHTGYLVASRNHWFISTTERFRIESGRTTDLGRVDVQVRR